MSFWMNLSFLSFFLFFSFSVRSHVVRREPCLKLSLPGQAAAAHVPSIQRGSRAAAAAGKETPTTPTTTSSSSLLLHVWSSVEAAAAEDGHDKSRTDMTPRSILTMTTTTSPGLARVAYLFATPPRTHRGNVSVHVYTRMIHIHMNMHAEWQRERETHFEWVIFMRVICTNSIMYWYNTHYAAHTVLSRM